MSLNKKIISLIKRKKMKLAISESCTGGMLSSAITSVSGSSKVFTMGLVTYSNQAKTSILKVPQKIIKKYGAVSVQCCLAMVNNLSKISNIILLDRLTIWNKLYKKIVVIREVIVPGANLNDPIPKHVTNK